MTIDPQTTVGDLVRQRPARSRVFEQLKIDYCCGGKLPLTQACAAAKLDPALVIQHLRALDAQEDQRSTAFVDADAMGLTQLADHIEQTHHAYLRVELPRLDYLTQRVLNAHGQTDPRLGQVREAFLSLQEELFSHMLKEERILFPLVREIETATQLPEFHCGPLANPIAQMEAEHDNAGGALATMHQATDGYQPPEWACNTYRAMLDGLQVLEADLHQHIHKENNVMFPKALAREAELGAKAGVACL